MPFRSTAQRRAFYAKLKHNTLYSYSFKPKSNMSSGDENRDYFRKQALKKADEEYDEYKAYQRDED